MILLISFENRKLQNITVFFIYFIFFLLLFLQFPLKNALPGNCDSLFVITLSKVYLKSIVHFFEGLPITSSMYPVKNVLLYGESSPGGAGLFLFFKAFGLSDIISYYLYLSLIFSLTAWGIWVVAADFIRSRIAAFFTGFAFSCSNFMFANIDDSVVFFFLLPALSIHYLIRYFDSEEKKYLIASVLLGSLQIYFSVYIFVYQGILLFIVTLFHYRTLLNRKNFFVFSGMTLLYIGLALPYAAWLLRTLFLVKVANPWPVDFVVSSSSLSWLDLFRVLPGNLIYPSIKIAAAEVFWPVIRRYAFTGLLPAGLGLVALLLRGWRNKNVWMLLTVMGVGFFMSFGFKSIPPHGDVPFYYKLFPFSHFLRVPSRAFILCVLSLSMLGGMGLDIIIRWLGGRRRAWNLILVTALFFVHSAEHVPFPFISFPLGEYLQIPKEYSAFFKDKKERLVLDLPSALGISFIDSHQTVFFYNREILYMNWQLQHKQNILGGVNGYFPESRINNQRAMSCEYPHKFIKGININYYMAGRSSAEKKDLFTPIPGIDDESGDFPEEWIERIVPDIEALKAIGVHYIVFHPDMIVIPIEREVLDFLNGSPLLIKEFENRRLSIFKIK